MGAEFLINKRLMMLAILLAGLLAVSAVSAADNATCDIADEEITADETVVIEENQEILSENDDYGTFTDLANLINKADINLTLAKNYRFTDADSKYVNGIEIRKGINIFGNGATIDGSNQARIFNVFIYSSFHDMNFINAKSDMGGAIMGSRDDSFAVYNSNFTNNHADTLGGALYNGHAINCSFKNNTAEYGGAIYIGAADNCTFEDNSAYYAGAVYNVYAVNSTFLRNHADDSCGAMFNNSAANCTFIGNYANNHSGAFGFGYASNSTFTDNHANHAGAFGFGTADSCIFKSNHADEGGAMFAGDAKKSVFIENHAIRGGALLGNVQVSNCSFENNYATEYGGAIFESYAERCNFTGNHAKRGGAIYNGPDGTAHCIFTNNSADEYGGALYGTYANNCTFTLNSANFGGAISSHSSASNSAFVSNTAKVSGSNKFDSYVFNCTYEGKLPKYTFYCPDFAAVEGFGTNINVKMYDSPGYYVDGERITVYIYDDKYKLVKSYSGQTGYNIFIDLPAGGYNAIISGDEDAYDINSINITGIIKKPTFIFAGNVNATYKDGKTLTIYLHGPDDEILTNKTISVTIAESAKNYTTDIKGQVIIPLDSLVPGNYSADISFAGDSVYVESSAQANVTINKLETKLTAEYDAGSENIVATVKDLKGNPVRGLEVGFAIDGVKYVTTDAKGQARYSTKGLGDKVHNVKVMVYGNDIYNDSNQETVKVGNKTQTKIFLRNALYFVTQTKLVRVTLWDANNHPLSNKTVYIRAYDSVWHGVTDENGDAYVRVGIGFGVHDATVGFDGDDDYNSSTRAGYIRVIKQTPSVMVRGADSQFKAGDSNKVVKVHLRDRYNQPIIANSKVAFKLNGKTYIGFTDINGVASIEISINTVGTFNAQALYGGNSAFNAVTRDIKIRIT